MEVMHPRCAGIDVSKRDAKVCIRVQGSGGRRTSSTVTTWGAKTRARAVRQLEALGYQVTIQAQQQAG